MRFYLVSYTRMLIGSKTRLTVQDQNMSEKDLKSILCDDSRFEHIVTSAILIQEEHAKDN